MRAALVVTAAAIATAAPSRAQTYSIVYEQADLAPNGELIGQILTCDVNDAGEHLLQLDLAFGAGEEFALFLDDALLHEFGDPVAGFPGATYAEVVGAPALGNGGEYKWTVLVDDGASSDRAALVNDGVAVLREGDAVLAPGAPALAVHRDFYGADVGAGDTFLARVGFDVGPPDSHHALMRVMQDPGTGQVDEEILVQVGGIPAGQTQAVERLFHPTLPHTAAYNERGEYAWVGELTGGPNGDGVVYRGDELVAQEYGFCEAAGETWVDLDDGIVELNEKGRVAVLGELQGPGGIGQEAVTFESRVVARSGDPIPFMTDGSTYLAFFGEGSVECSDFGEVAYLATWQDGSGPARVGLFVDHRPLIEKGVTVVDGKTVQNFAGGPQTFAMSDDGRYLLVLVLLGSDDPAVIEIDRGARPTEFCFGDGQADVFTPAVSCPCSNESDVGDGEGCENSTGKGAFLGLQGSLSVLEGDTRFSVYQARGVQPGVLVQGSNPIQVPFRDGLLCMGTPTERIEVVFTDAAGHAQTVSDVAAEGNVSTGDVRGYQMWFRDPDISLCGTGSNLTQAIVVPWQ